MPAVPSAAMDTVTAERRRLRSVLSTANRSHFIAGSRPAGQHTVAALRQAAVVGGDHKGRAFGVAAFAHQVQHLVGGVRIQAGRGFVGDHQARPLDQRAGHGHTLALAARQGIGPMRRMLVQAHGAQLLGHALAPLGGGHAGDEQRVVHVLGHRHHRHQVEVLEDEAQRVAAQHGAADLVQVLHGWPPSSTSPLSGASIRPQRFRIVRLAAAGRAGQRQQFAGHDAQVHAAQRRHHVLAQAVGLVSGLDATFLYLETPEMPMHVGALHVLRTAGRLPGRFVTATCAAPGQPAADGPGAARRLWWMPLNLANPAWVDAEPDLRQHVVEVKLPKGAGLAELEKPRSARLHPVLLDRKRPLWKMHVFEGLAPTAERLRACRRLHPAAPCRGRRAGRRGAGQRAAGRDARAARDRARVRARRRSSSSAWSRCCAA
jgi:hypothetical protein